ncbi:Hypothetical predicted protein [Lecanosticta acicola]|uniref:Uncharacterized protein n=1 Tax=Lecanosticta acicola TaxID=111012 RepID=A0AAI8YZ94_9PEZI|nr:Hypothetical predicted protein [Lecanosticta acicola]
MSLHEAYTLAHTAQCRLQMEASRPDRKLRFVVGHLLHYESMRLRIVEIEHDISKRQRARSVTFQGAGHIDNRLQHKPSTAQLGRKSPPPTASTYDDDEDDDLDDMRDDEEDAGLSLQRFPSRSSRPPDMVPDEEDDDDEDEDDEEPISPHEPDAETLEKCVKGEGNEVYASMYEGVRKCRCHGKTDAPSFDRMWELPPDQQGEKEGVTRAVAHVRDVDAAPKESCTVTVPNVQVEEVAA